MEQKNWKTTALYYGSLILVMLAGFVFLQGRLKIPENSQSPPQDLRIVSLAPNLTEILFAMDLGRDIVAVSSDSNYPAQALAKKKAGSFWNPDLEAVLSVQPTLVFTLGFQQQANLAAQLENIDCRTVSLEMENLAQLYKAIETIGSLTNRQESAARLIEQIAGGLEKYKGQAAAASPARVLWVVQRDPIRAAASNTFFNELIEMAGAQNAIQTTLFQYPPLDQEQMIAAAPDVIIETADSPEDLLRLRSTRNDFYARYKNVPAVINNRLFVIDGDLVCRLGPRLPLGMEAIITCIRPQTSEQRQTHADIEKTDP